MNEKNTQQTLEKELKAMTGLTDVIKTNITVNSEGLTNTYLQTIYESLQDDCNPEYAYQGSKWDMPYNQIPTF